MNYQDNVDDFYQTAPELIEEQIRLLPFIMYYEYNKYIHLENSNKVIAPVSLLYKLSKFENIEYPVKFKIKDYQFVFSIFEFKEDIDVLYVPNHIIEQYGINIDEIQNLEIINKPLVKATSISIKPHNQDYLKIPDIKLYLEATLKNLYTCIFKNQTLRLPYLDGAMYFDITNINNYGDNEELNDPLSIIDVDLEVTIETSYLYNSQQNNEYPIEDARNLSMNIDDDKLIDEITDNESDEFTSFSGQGFKLGSN
jgi:hypothetical protein